MYMFLRHKISKYKMMMQNLLFILAFFTLSRLVGSSIAVDDSPILTINRPTIILENCLQPMNVEFPDPDSDTDMQLNLQIQPLNYKPINYWPDNSQINMSICYFGRVYQLFLWKEDTRTVDFGVLLYKDNDATHFYRDIPNIVGRLIDPESICDLVFYGVLEQGILLGRIYGLQCEKSINQQIRRATEGFSAKLFAQQRQNAFLAKERINTAVNEDDKSEWHALDKEEKLENKYGQPHTPSPQFHSFIVINPRSA